MPDTTLLAKAGITEAQARAMLGQASNDEEFLKNLISYGDLGTGTTFSKVYQKSNK